MIMAVTNKDFRIGTMVKCNSGDPAAYVRQIIPHGFESLALLLADAGWR
jgi:hypothetical protein